MNPPGLKFNTAADIPDPVAKDYLLPSDDSSLWAPVNPDLTINTGIAAVELAFIYLDAEHRKKPSSTGFLRQIIVASTPAEIRHYLADHYMDHANRALARVILHPVRDQLFDLAEVYEAEIEQDYPDRIRGDDPTFFGEFIQHWGVLERGDSKNL